MKAKVSMRREQTQFVCILAFKKIESKTNENQSLGAVILKVRRGSEGSGYRKRFDNPALTWMRSGRW